MPINAGPSSGMMVPGYKKKPAMLNSSGGGTPGNLPRGMVDSSGPGNGNAPPGGPMGFDRKPRMISMMGGMDSNGGGASSISRNRMAGGAVDPRYRDMIANAATSRANKPADPNAVRMQNAGYGGRNMGLPDFQQMQNQRMQEMQMQQPQYNFVGMPSFMGGMGQMGMGGYNPMMGMGGGMGMQNPMRQYQGMPSFGGFNPGMNSGISGGGYGMSPMMGGMQGMGQQNPMAGLLSRLYGGY